MIRYLLDTNILLRALYKGSPQRQEVMDALSSLRSNGDLLCIAPQVVTEFWSVATRPADVNGLGLTTGFVSAYVDRILRHFYLLEENRSLFNNWLALVRVHEVLGKNVHDTRLVAIMQTYDVEHLLTFNVDDFKRYQEIKPVHPREVLAQGSQT